MRNVSEGTVISSCPIFGLGVSKKRARRCTACLVTTVVELILEGRMFVNDRTSGAFSIWGPQDS